jgi:hypothetical protein
MDVQKYFLQMITFLELMDGTSTNVTHLRVSRLNMYSQAEI